MEHSKLVQCAARSDLRVKKKNKVMAQEIIELFDEQDIKLRVEKVWGKVFSASNKVISQAKNFGFSGIEIIPSPNIHDMLVRLQVFSAVIDILVTHAELFEVEYAETRLLLNAKEQITRMERVAAALKANNRADYIEAISTLESQACF